MGKTSISKIVLPVVLVLVCLFVGYLLFYKSSFQGEKSVAPVIYDTLPEGYKFDVMAENKYPEGFPESLIVKGGEWQRAEDTENGYGKRMRVVELIYKRIEPAFLLPLFQKNFEDNNWTTDEIRNTGSTIVRVFGKDSDTMTLTIVPISENSLVNFTYVTSK